MDVSIETYYFDYHSTGNSVNDTKTLTLGKFKNMQIYWTIPKISVWIIEYAIEVNVKHGWIGFSLGVLYEIQV